MNARKPQYLVIRNPTHPHAKLPTKVHNSYEEACNEAERLARKSVDTFYVVSIIRASSAEVKIQHNVWLAYPPA